jgi:hypothetical protein
MVDTVQPQGLLSFRNRSASSPLKKMQLLRWNNADPIPRARHPTSVFYGERGWMSRKFPRLPVEGEVFSLTSPFIDQAFTLKTPSQGSMSVIGIYRQPVGTAFHTVAAH